MLFNSIDFAVFLPIVFILYWFVVNKNINLQNLLIVFASYFFYGWWDWRFLFLIVFSSVVDYFIGLAISKEKKASKKKLLLWISLSVNLGLLGFFKYYNFFLDNFVSAFSFFGSDIEVGGLNVILPVGISFYTFQTLSYSIDIYRGKLVPTKDFVAFSAFVSFFPQLVAGPIERATHLLPQFYKKRTFNYDLAVDGLKQILWGLFKKVVIADNCAKYANIIFNDSADYSGSTLILGAVLFAFQIYGDFSGYSDIAIGVSRLFGFDLMKNFAFPYFSRDIGEFWRRWHISLSTWFRDYLYIPLGGSRGTTASKVRNTFIIFAVSGFWHGANWTFIVWGLLNAIYFIPLLLSNKNRINVDTVAQGKFFPSIKELLQIGITFLLTVFAWIFFRAKSVSHALDYIKGICDTTLFSIPAIPQGANKFEYALLFLFLCVFIVIEWIHREKEYGLQIQGVHRIISWPLFILITITIILFGGSQQDFIYFQF